MYLHKKTYVKNWEHMTPEQKHAITITRGGKPTGIKPERINEISEEVGYWRKANHIHAWIVEHIQDGQDDCKEYEFSSEKMEELLTICKKVLDASKLVAGKIANGKEYDSVTKTWTPVLVDGRYIEDASVAKELLPTQSGFFFGSEDYDEYYLQDVKDTIEILEPLVKELKEGDYTGTVYYQSSW